MGCCKLEPEEVATQVLDKINKSSVHPMHLLMRDQKKAVDTSASSRHLRGRPPRESPRGAVGRGGGGPNCCSAQLFRPRSLIESISGDSAIRKRNLQLGTTMGARSIATGPEALAAESWGCAGRGLDIGRPWSRSAWSRRALTVAPKENLPFDETATWRVQTF